MFAWKCCLSSATIIKIFSHQIEKLNNTKVRISPILSVMYIQSKNTTPPPTPPKKIEKKADVKVFF